jgi:hypothetical protein
MRLLITSADLRAPFWSPAAYNAKRVGWAAQACDAVTSVGCCATSFVDMLKVYMKLMCVQASSKIAAAFRNLYPLCIDSLIGSGIAVPLGCSGFDPGQYTPLAPDQCPTENKFQVPQFG